MVDANEALKHWAAWARDNGNWRTMCRSIEHRYSFDPERYVFELDKEKQNRFRYNPLIAEKIEKMVRKLHKTEKIVVIASFVYFPHMSDEQIAKKLDMPSSSYTSFLESAIRRVRRLYV